MSVCPQAMGNPILLVELMSLCKNSGAVPLSVYTCVGLCHMLIMGCTHYLETCGSPASMCKLK